MNSKSEPLRKNAPENRIRILIADDHVTVREGLVAMIGRQPDMIVVGEAANGGDAVDLWRRQSPDVTLLDLRMPLVDGVGAIREIRHQDGSARIVVLTTFDTDTDVSKAIKAGANGYLLKDAPLEELLDSIRRVHAGETIIPSPLVAKLAESLRNDPLTSRELEVLALLVRGRSNKEVGGILFISETTVKAHLRNIFTKLNVLSRTEAIAVANRRGLVGQ